MNVFVYTYIYTIYRIFYQYIDIYIDEILDVILQMTLFLNVITDIRACFPCPIGDDSGIILHESKHAHVETLRAMRQLLVQTN